MTLQTLFGILVVLYTVSNLASMGLELNLRETIKSLRRRQASGAGPRVGLGGWPGFRVSAHKGPSAGGPVCHRAVHLQPCADGAPFLPVLVRKARADMDFSAALMPLVMVATVVLLPLMAPLLMKGLTVSTWSLAKPLLLLVLLPLAVCAAIKGYAAFVAHLSFPRGQAACGNLHPADARLHRGVLLPRVHPHTGQLCHRRGDHFRPRDSNRIVSGRLRPEAGTARHGAGHVHPQCLRNVRGVHCLSKPGPAHRW